MQNIVNPDGGRNVLNDDLILLQGEAAKAFSSMFEGLEGNFVVSGCEVTAAAGGLYDIAPGMVWIDGKLREFAGTTAPVSVPCYLEPHDYVVEERAYEDAVNRPAIYNFGARVSASPYVPELPGGGGGGS